MRLLTIFTLLAALAGGAIYAKANAYSCTTQCYGNTCYTNCY